MKTVTINALAGCFVLMTMATTTFGQAALTPIEEGGKMPNKLAKSNVPVVVAERYVTDYPTTTYETWYGYPAFANESDWYGYNPYYYTDTNPEYYIVEFEKDETPHKVIYSKAGKKIATHRRMKTNVPMAVSEGFNRSAYKGWELAKEKEEIYSDADKTKVYYRLIVGKGSERHALYFQSDGKLVKDKKLKTS